MFSAAFPFEPIDFFQTKRCSSNKSDRKTFFHRSGSVSLGRSAPRGEQSSVRRAPSPCSPGLKTPGFELQTESTPVQAGSHSGDRRPSVAQSGSDGLGYTIAESFGHTTSDRIFPALVPLVLPGGHAFREVAGVSLPASLTVVSRSGHLAHTEGDLLLRTSASRDQWHWTSVTLTRCLPGRSRGAGAGEPSSSRPSRRPTRPSEPPGPIQSWLRDLFPDRLAAAVLDLSETSGQTACAQLTKQRLAVRTTITRHRSI